MKLYKKVFNAELVSEYKNDDGSYIHAELNAFGQIIAISEADDNVTIGSNMQFCFHFGKQGIENANKAYEILKEDAQVTFPLGPCPFSPLMFGLIDKFGINWCIFV